MNNLRMMVFPCIRIIRYGGEVSSDASKPRIYHMTQPTSWFLVFFCFGLKIFELGMPTWLLGSSV